MSMQATKPALYNRLRQYRSKDENLMLVIEKNLLQVVQKTPA